jgi:hypothetical protein
LNTFVADPESQLLQQIAVVRGKDEAELARQVNEKLAEIKIEGGKLRELKFFPEQQPANSHAGMTVVAVYDVSPTVP